MRLDSQARVRAFAIAGADLSPIQVAVCAAVLVAADWSYRQVGDSFFPGGPLDETAHLVTAMLLLQTLPQRWRAPIALPALIASVAIDLDHVPQYLGYYFFTEGTPRPYTHSLLTVAVLILIAAMLGRHRRLFLGLAVGVSLHFFRDLAEGGNGVALLWPLTDRAFSYPHNTYLLIIACVITADLWLAAVRTRSVAEVV